MKLIRVFGHAKDGVNLNSINCEEEHKGYDGTCNYNQIDQDISLPGLFRTLLSRSLSLLDPATHTLPNLPCHPNYPIDHHSPFDYDTPEQAPPHPYY